MEGECQLRAGRFLSTLSHLVSPALTSLLAVGFLSGWMFLPQCSPGACGHHAVSGPPDTGFLDHISALTTSLYLTFWTFDPECTLQIGGAPCLASSVLYPFLWVKVSVSHDCVPRDNGSLRRSALGFWSKEVICLSNPSVKPQEFGEKKF